MRASDFLSGVGGQGEAENSRCHSWLQVAGADEHGDASCGHPKGVIRVQIWGILEAVLTGLLMDWMWGWRKEKNQDFLLPIRLERRSKGWWHWQVRSRFRCWGEPKSSFKETLHLGLLLFIQVGMLRGLFAVRRWNSQGRGQNGSGQCVWHQPGGGSYRQETGYDYSMRTGREEEDKAEFRGPLQSGGGESDKLDHKLGKFFIFIKGLTIDIFTLKATPPHLLLLNSATVLWAWPLTIQKQWVCLCAKNTLSTKGDAAQGGQ